MSDPWDPPSFPDHGEEDGNALFAGIGRVTSKWEELEVSLTKLHAYFLGEPDRAEAHHNYGEGTIFNNRLRNLTNSAMTFFIKKPDQGAEAKFCGLIRNVKQFSQRRNDIAHGIVNRVQSYRGWRVGDVVGGQFVLVPPHYRFRELDKNYIPKWGYLSQNLVALETSLNDVILSLEAFRRELFPAAGQ